MAAPAFGFSVGDFVATIELISTVIKALRTTHGASSKYIQVLNQLVSLKDILDQLRALEPTQDDAAFVNAVRAATFAAQYPLNNFLSKIQEYDPALNPTHRTKLSGRVVRAVKWSVLVEDQVDKLRACLSGHVLSISLLMQLRERKVGDVKESKRQLQHEQLVNSLSHQQTSIDSIDTNARAIRGETQTFHQKVLDDVASVRLSSRQQQNVMDDVKQIATNLASRFGDFSDTTRQYHQQMVHSVMENTERLVKIQQDMTRIPATQPASSINLVDALDRTFSLPYEFFSEYTIVQSFLKSKFADTPGAIQVKSGRYQLSREGRKPLVVTGENWSRSIFPGSRVSMAIMLSSRRAPSRRCPRPSCYQELSSADLENPVVRCGQCGLTWQEYNPRAIGGPQSELKGVVDLQRKEDNVEFGSKFPPKDLSVIASISGGRTLSTSASALSFQSAKSPRMGRGMQRDVQTDAHHYVVNSNNALTEDNLSMLQRNIEGLPSRDNVNIDSSATRVEKSTTSASNWHGGFSGMIVWLNHSAFREWGIRPPTLVSEVGEDSEHEHECADEEDEIEILRRVCIPQATPASTHYLDASEFAGIGIRTMPYLRKIIDRFPKVPPYIARRLAEKNLTRSERLTKVRRTVFKTKYEGWQLEQVENRSRERRVRGLTSTWISEKQNKPARRGRYESEEYEEIPLAGTWIGEKQNQPARRDRYESEEDEEISLASTWIGKKQNQPARRDGYESEEDEEISGYFQKLERLKNIRPPHSLLPKQTPEELPLR